MFTQKTVLRGAPPWVVMDRRAVIAGLAAGSVFAVSGCSYNSALDRSQLILVSDEEMEEMAIGAWMRVKSTANVSRNRTSNRKLEQIGTRIVDAADAGAHDWEFLVIDDPTVNAFAMPGGKVAFYQGLMDITDNDDQIACVMGHEVGHVKARHGAERASQQLAANAGMQVANIALQAEAGPYADSIAGVLGAGVTFGVILPYSRQHEYEADKLGVNFMNQADYRPQEALTFWRNMTAQKEGAPAEFMSTHPSDESRIAALETEIAALS